jgi:hypothetical protein
MGQEQPDYLAYLLRLWRTGRTEKAGRPIWRASLEAPGSGRQIHFETLAALCTYLVSQMGLVEATSSATDDEGKNENDDTCTANAI